MRSAFALACVAILGAQAINVTQVTPTKEMPEATGTGGADAEEEPMMLTTYIGFEFEGAELAEKFSSLTADQQNDVRIQVQDLIDEYWTEVGSPVGAPVDQDVDEDE